MNDPLRTTLRLTLFGLWLLSLWLLPQACAAPFPSRGNPQHTYVGGEAGEVEEVFGDARLRRQFQLVGVRTQRREGRLFVQFDLQNRTNSNLAVEYALEWRDDQGFKVDSPANWRPVQVGGRGSHTITATAPVPAASTFTLGVRKPSPVR